MPCDGPVGVGVAITTYRRPWELDRCLAAVAGLGDAVRAVCVVDDDPGSFPHARPPELATDIAFVSLVQPANTGLAAALTRAFETLAGCDEVLVLDDDTVVDAPLIDRLRAALQPGVGAATVPTTHNVRFGCAAGPALFAWSPTLVRRRALEAVGPPEASLFFGYDDWDLALRLREAHWRIAWVDASVARRSAGTPWPERRYFAVRNAVWLATRRPRGRALFGRVLVTDLVATVRSLGVGVVRGRMRSGLRETRAAAVGLAHGLRGRLGPPPTWVLAGRGSSETRPAAPARAPRPAHAPGAGALAGLERDGRRRIGVARVALARTVGRLHGVAPPSSADRLRILADLDTFPPVTNAGSEQSLAATLAFLADRGHAVRVLVPRSQHAGDRHTLDVRVADRDAVSAAYRWCDVVCTQLGAYNRSARRAARHGRPVVAFLRHSRFDPNEFYAPPDLLVYCASWIETRQPWPGRSVVVHPPIDADACRTTPGEHLTMVNLSLHKGGDLVDLLARRLPHHQFLGVLGAWGDQLVPDPQPCNVRIVPNTPHPRSIYAATRVLLHPSVDEGYPRVVLEAAVSGIPTIAHPADGTRAALADAAIYVDRDDVDGWVAAVARLDDPLEYDRCASRARQRFAEHDHQRELLALERALLTTARRT